MVRRGSRPRTRTPGFTGFKRIRFEVAPNQVLEPRSYAQCYIVLGEGEDTLAEFIKTDGLVRIFDGLGQTDLHGIDWGQNYYLEGERGTACWNQETKRYEVEGSYGLLRRGKADVAITAGSAGLVSIWARGTDSGFNVFAWYEWITVLPQIRAGMNVRVRYVVDLERWEIADHGC